MGGTKQTHFGAEMKPTWIGLTTRGEFLLQIVTGKGSMNALDLTFSVTTQNALDVFIECVFLVSTN